MNRPGRRRRRVRRVESRVGHGIFCLEGQWEEGFHRQSSVRPILELLQTWDPRLAVPYVYKTVDVREALAFYLSWWVQSKGNDFPILYLAFHGGKGSLLLHKRSGGTGARILEDEVKLGQLGEMLGPRCQGRVLFLAGCRTLYPHGHVLRSLCRRTGALAIIGYRAEVTWLRATAFEAIVLSSFSEVSMTRRGVRAALRNVHEEAGSLARELEFTVVSDAGVM